MPVSKDGENSPKKSVWKEFGQNLFDCTKNAIIIFGILFVITRLFFPIAFIPSSSMEPMIPKGSLNICSMLDYYFGNTPQRGDVVLFSRDKNTGDSKMYVKRIVGLPGETVEIIDGQTYINGELYQEYWLAETPDDLDFGPYVIPEGKYFCMGDNRNNSFDCRYWPEHFISEENIIAKDYFVISSGPSIKTVS